MAEDNVKLTGFEQHWKDWSVPMLKLHWKKAQFNPWHFLTQFVYTTDPHDPEHSIKLFPPKTYLEFLVSTWLREKRLVVEKSRKMIITWCMLALHLWLASRTPGAFIYFQSQKEDKADRLIQRAYHIWKYLPELLRPQAVYTYCKLKFPVLDSIIQGVPQGTDVIMDETVTAIFSDEQSTQEQAEEAFMIGKPTIDAGGRYTAVGTARAACFMKRLVFDELE